MWAPIGALDLAVQGRIDFVNGILVAVFGKKEDRAADLAKEPGNPVAAMKALLTFVGDKQARDGRHRKKQKS